MIVYKLEKLCDDSFESFCNTISFHFPDDATVWSIFKKSLFRYTSWLQEQSAPLLTRNQDIIMFFSYGVPRTYFFTFWVQKFWQYLEFLIAVFIADLKQQTWFFMNSMFGRTDDEIYETLDYSVIVFILFLSKEIRQSFHISIHLK